VGDERKEKLEISLKKDGEEKKAILRAREKKKALKRM
jgi:hypothetical protein